MAPELLNSNKKNCNSNTIKTACLDNVMAMTCKNINNNLGSCVTTLFFIIFFNVGSPHGLPLFDRLRSIFQFILQSLQFYFIDDILMKSVSDKGQSMGCQHTVQKLLYFAIPEIIEVKFFYP